jgi:hypothetical protein
MLITVSRTAEHGRMQLTQFGTQEEAGRFRALPKRLLKISIA